MVIWRFCDSVVCDPEGVESNSAGGTHGGDSNPATHAEGSNEIRVAGTDGSATSLNRNYFFPV